MRFLGITDEVETCDCCGKTGLKRTVAFEAPASHTAPVLYYGTTCAARHTRTPANHWAGVARDEEREAEKLYRRAYNTCPEQDAHTARINEAERLRVPFGQERISFLETTAKALRDADNRLRAEYGFRKDDRGYWRYDPSLNQHRDEINIPDTKKLPHWRKAA